VISLPVIVCARQSGDCYLSGNTYFSLVGLEIPAVDRWGYRGALALAAGIAVIVAVSSWTLFSYRDSLRSSAPSGSSGNPRGSV
jgi:NhaP-type Na+/H+ or K+/H+ antiporter